MRYYQFKESDAELFQRYVNANARKYGNELQFQYCPYCHGGRHRDAKTFSINLTTGQFECKRSSCGAHGNMITLAKDFDFSLGTEYDRYYNQETFKFRKFGKKKIQTTGSAIDYLKKRGISQEITEQYKITTQKENSNILVFPFFDENGIMVSIKYRKADFNPEKDKNKEWFEPGCMPALFGMEQCEDFETLIITEGQIDSLSIAESGIKNAVSVPNGARGFTWVPHCWDWFSKFKRLIVFGDRENGKITLLNELETRFPGTVCSVRQEDYLECKDANEILQKYGREAIQKAIKNATPIPVKRVKRLSEVESVDIYSMKKIRTGIRSLDMILGGFYEGQVVVLTGKRGGGKSTFASQLLTNAIEQRKKVFAYSGELQDYFFKRWIDLQIAGKRNIIEDEDMFGQKRQKITKSNLEKINQWYRNFAFIYDNNIIEDEEIEDLLKTIKEAVMQYGIEMVLIDNLMTSIEVDINSDLYRAQSRFVNKLCKIAKRHKVVILLIVHPRKNTGYKADENDEVSGSADITNRVDVVMTYKKDDELKEDERYLSISKNRLTGQLTKNKGIKLYYDETSKRISDQATFDDVYGWEKDEDGFTEARDLPLPF